MRRFYQHLNMLCSFISLFFTAPLSRQLTHMHILNVMVFHYYTYEFVKQYLKTFFFAYFQFCYLNAIVVHTGQLFSRLCVHVHACSDQTKALKK